ncbi:MAG: MFS transporter [Oscillospiraceae bacterium]
METKKVLPDYFKWVMLFIAALVNGILLGYQSSSLAILMPQISEEMGWTPLQMSNVMSAQGLGTTFLILFAGMLLDKFSTKWLIAISTIICGAMIFARGYAQDFTMYFASMIIFGLSAAIYQPALPRLNTLWFDKKDTYKTNGMMVALASVGSLLANTFTVQITNALGGWRQQFIATGIVCFIVALLWIVIAKDRKPEDAALVVEKKEPAEKVEKPSLMQNIKAVCSTKIAWILIVSEFFSYGAQRCFVLYGATTLIKGWGIDRAAAGQIIALSNAGSIVGLVLIPIIGDFIGKRKPMVVGGWLIRGVFAIIAVMCKDPMIAAGCFFISGMAAGAGIPGARTLLLEQGNVGGLRAGTAMGVLMLFGRLGEVVLSNLYGMFLSASGNYLLGGALSFIGFLVAAVMIMTVPDTGTKAKKVKA